MPSSTLGAAAIIEFLSSQLTSEIATKGAVGVATDVEFWIASAAADSALSLELPQAEITNEIAGSSKPV